MRTSYTTQGSRGLRHIVNELQQAVVVEEVAGETDQFTELLDTPDNYTGAAGKLVAVNQTENGLIFQNDKSSGIPVVTINFDDFVLDFAGEVANFNTKVADIATAGSKSILIRLERETTGSFLSWFNAVEGDEDFDLSQFEEVYFKSRDQLRLGILDANFKFSEKLRILNIDRVYLGAFEILPVDEVGTTTSFSNFLTVKLIGGAISSTGAPGPNARPVEFRNFYTKSSCVDGLFSFLNYPFRSQAGVGNSEIFCDSLTGAFTGVGEAAFDLLPSITYSIIMDRPYSQGSATKPYFTTATSNTVTIKVLYVNRQTYTSGGLRPSAHFFVDGKDAIQFDIENAVYQNTTDVRNIKWGAQLSSMFPVDTGNMPIAIYENLTLQNFHYEPTDWSSFNQSIIANITKRLVLHNVHFNKDTDVFPFFSLISDCTVQVTDCFFNGTSPLELIEENAGTNPTVDVIVSSSILGLSGSGWQWLKGVGTTANGNVAINKKGGVVLGGLPCTIYIHKDGIDDPSAGAADNPAKTLTYALNNLKHPTNHTVFWICGEVTEPAALDISAFDNFTIKGDCITTSKLIVTGTLGLEYHPTSPKSDVVIQDLTIDNQDDDSNSTTFHMELEADVTNFHIRDCRFVGRAHIVQVKTFNDIPAFFFKHSSFYNIEIEWGLIPTSPGSTIRGWHWRYASHKQSVTGLKFKNLGYQSSGTSFTGFIQGVTAPASAKMTLVNLEMVTTCYGDGLLTAIDGGGGDDNSITDSFICIDIPQNSIVNVISGVGQIRAERVTCRIRRDLNNTYSTIACTLLAKGSTDVHGEVEANITTSMTYTADNLAAVVLKDSTPYGKIHGTLRFSVPAGETFAHTYGATSRVAAVVQGNAGGKGSALNITAEVINMGEGDINNVSAALLRIGVNATDKYMVNNLEAALVNTSTGSILNGCTALMLEANAAPDSGVVGIASASLVFTDYNSPAGTITNAVAAIGAGTPTLHRPSGEAIAYKGFVNPSTGATVAVGANEGMV